MSARKNILKKLEYDTLQIQEVNFLPPRFDGNMLFIFPFVGVSSSHTKAKPMDGMDKRYDGHVWTKIQTTNITNNMGLVCRFSSYVGQNRKPNIPIGTDDETHCPDTFKISRPLFA